MGSGGPMAGGAWCLERTPYRVHGRERTGGEVVDAGPSDSACLHALLLLPSGRAPACTFWMRTARGRRSALAAPKRLHRTVRLCWWAELSGCHGSYYSGPDSLKPMAGCLVSTGSARWTLGSGQTREDQDLCAWHKRQGCEHVIQ